MKSTIKRRTFIQASSTWAMASMIDRRVRASSPTILVPKRYHLRVLGTHVTLQETLRQQAEKELGISISFQPGGSAAVLHQASIRPDSFDIYEQWSNSIPVLWNAGAIQAIETARIKHWSEVNELSKTGRLTPNARIGRGDAPHKLIYVQKNNSLGSQETSRISFVPYVHNADSIGYNASIIGEGVPYKTESWGWLFDPRFHGAVALVNAPSIGIFDAALAAEATGRMRFRDIGDISRRELDELFEHLIELKTQGHFRGLWSSVPQSQEFMARDGVVVESMFSPGVAALRGIGINCIYAAPAEGYRAWHGVMCLSAATSGPTRDAAYAFMSWWLSGWPGAHIARQGYYISTPSRSRPYLDKSEWEYWYGGKPASRDLPNTSGEISVKKGELRRGGSYEQRFKNVAVWNTVMRTYEYSLIKWNEFLLT